MARSLRGSLLAFLIVLLSTTAVTGRSRHNRRSGASDVEAGNFDYYLLTLSWAPDFCAFGNGQKDPRECGSGRHVGFVVHGLWPQSEQGRGPERCGPARPVSQSILNATLSYIPTESLIQHEWANHGTCSGLSAADYFAMLRKARDAVKLPRELIAPTQKQQLSPSQIEAEFAAANPRYPAGAFRATCQNSALQEVRICVNKDLSPRACSESAGHCNMSTMAVLPVQ